MNRSVIGDYRKQIAGRNVMILFTWNNYSPADYRRDFKDYKDYLEGVYSLHPDALKGLANSARDIPEEKIFLETIKQEIEYDLAKHPIELKDKEMVSFEEFRKTSENKVSQIVFQLLSQDPALIPAIVEKPQNADDIFAIEIDVEAVREREYYAFHMFEKSGALSHLDKERMSFKVSGYWLLHNIVIPTCHLPDDSVHHEDARILWLQQLKEHQDVVEGTLIHEKQIVAKLRTYVGKNDSRNVFYLYMSVHGVWSAVTSEFYSYYNTKHYITIPAGAIQNYHRLLQALAAQPENKARTFYEQYIGSQNIGATGEYSMGKILGAMASVVTSENYRKPYNIFMDGNEIKTNSLEDRKRIIRDAIINNKEIGFANFDQAAVNDVLKYVRSEPNLRKFIDYVEQCFSDLNIPSENQILNNSIFNGLVKDANARKRN
jgi:hypothetical protein